MKIEDMQKQVSRLGISGEEFSKWEKDDLKRLSNGYLTKGLKKITVNGKKIDVKLSFKDGKLKVHPKKKDIKNTQKFSKEQLKRLKEGKTIFKDRKVYQLDKDINEVMSIKSTQLANRLPNQFNGRDLTAEDKKDISTGKSIDDKGTTTEVIANLVISDPLLLLTVQTIGKAVNLVKDNTMSKQMDRLNPFSKSKGASTSVANDTATHTQASKPKINNKNDAYKPKKSNRSRKQ